MYTYQYITSILNILPIFNSTCIYIPPAFISSLQHRRKHPENILHHPHPKTPVQTEIQVNLMTILHRLHKIILDILDHPVLINPHTILKMQIQTPVSRLIVPTTPISSSHTNDFACRNPG